MRRKESIGNKRTSRTSRTSRRKRKRRKKRKNREARRERRKTRRKRVGRRERRTIGRKRARRSRARSGRSRPTLFWRTAARRRNGESRGDEERRHVSAAVSGVVVVELNGVGTARKTLDLGYEIRVGIESARGEEIG